MIEKPENKSSHFLLLRVFVPILESFHQTIDAMKPSCVWVFPKKYAGIKNLPSICGTFGHV